MYDIVEKIDHFFTLLPLKVVPLPLPYARPIQFLHRIQYTGLMFQAFNSNCLMNILVWLLNQLLQWI